MTEISFVQVVSSRALWLIRLTTCSIMTLAVLHVFFDRYSAREVVVPDITPARIFVVNPEVPSAPN